MNFESLAKISEIKSQLTIPIIAELQLISSEVSVNISAGFSPHFIKVKQIPSDKVEWIDESPVYKGYVLDRVLAYDTKSKKLSILAVARIAKNKMGDPEIAKNKDGDKILESYKKNKDIQGIIIEARKIKVDELKRLSKVPEKYSQKTMHSYECPTESHKKLIKIVNNYVENFRDFGVKNGLYLFGGVGIGKTHIACTIINELINRYLVSCYYTSVANLLNELKNTFDGEGKVQNIIHKYSTCKFLVLDDIGAEKPSERGLETLYTIVNNRYEKMLPTIFTSNLSVEQLGDRVGARISDRIFEMCEVVGLSFKDSFRGKF